MQDLIALQVKAVVEEINLILRGQQLLQQQEPIRFSLADIAGLALSRMQIECGEQVAAGKQAFAQPQDIEDPKRNRPQRPKRRDRNSSSQQITAPSFEAVQVVRDKFAHQGKRQLQPPVLGSGKQIK